MTTELGGPISQLQVMRLIMWTYKSDTWDRSQIPDVRVAPPDH